MIYECYLFNRSGNYYAVTPSMFSKTLLGRTYTPSPVKRSAIPMTDVTTKNEVTFTFPELDTFATEMLLNVQEVPATVTVYRNGAIFWVGLFVYARNNNKLTDLVFNDFFITTLVNVRHKRLSVTCNHLLFDSDCGVNKASFATNVSVSGISGLSFTAATGKPSGYFTHGTAEINNQARTLLEHSGDNFQLLNAFEGAQTGTLKLYPSCDLSVDTCLEKFDNLDNFGGFPFCPARNPYDGSGAL